jgi:hypothetical protein
MTLNAAAIARDSCPLCGGTTRIPLLQLMPSRWKSAFRCSSCLGWIRVAKSTQGTAFVGGLLGPAAVFGMFYLLAPVMYRLGLVPAPHSNAQGLWILIVITAVGASFMAAAIPFARRTMRLEPAPDGPGI